MITFTSTGDFKRTETFLQRMKQRTFVRSLSRYGDRGVSALQAATPRESGETADSWSYKIENSRSSFRISWFNSHTNAGANIAILIQYGHGTGTGGYVAGFDYINPAMRPIFDDIAEGIWREVTSA